MSESIENELLFTTSHEWVKLEENIATVGISDHAQEALGDIVFVSLPEENMTVTAKQDCAVVESVKSASDIYAPLSGTIIATNSAVSDNPQSINEDPYKNWLFKISFTNKEELTSLLSAKQYHETL